MNHVLYSSLACWPLTDEETKEASLWRCLHYHATLQSNGKAICCWITKLKNQDMENRITPLFTYSCTKNKSGRKYTKVLTLVNSAHSNQRGLGCKIPCTSAQGPQWARTLLADRLTHRVSWVLPLSSSEETQQEPSAEARKRQACEPRGDPLCLALLPCPSGWIP